MAEQRGDRYYQTAKGKVYIDLVDAKIHERWASREVEKARSAADTAQARLQEARLKLREATRTRRQLELTKLD